MFQTNQSKPPYAMIAILFLGAFIAFLNNTLLNVALPTIMKEFSVSPSMVQWLTTGYMLVNGILIPASAFFVTRFKNRHLFITAMSLFALGTVLAVIAPEFWVLILSRMIQASGSAMMMPLLMNVMLTAFPIERRGAAMGVFGLVMIVAPAIGPTLSGWVIEHYSWRTLYEIILPCSILILLLAIWKLKNITPNEKVSLDIFSLVLSSIGFGGVLYGFSSAGDKGWTDSVVLTTIIVGVIALIIFVIRQSKLEKPLLDMDVFRYPMFTLSSIISSIVAMALFSGMILTPLYVQTIRGISPFHAGLLMLPGALLMGVMSPITGKLFDKYGARLLSVIGLTIMSVTTYMLTKLTYETTFLHLMMVYTIRSLGISMVMMPISTNGLNQLPQRLNPHGSAMNSTLSQVSGAIGSALLLTIMNNKTVSNTTSMMEETMKNHPGLTGTALQNLQMKVKMDAFLDAINYSFFVSMCITIVAIVLALFVKRVIPVKPQLQPTKQKNMQQKTEAVIE